MVDDRLAQSFRLIGADYHRYRPGFPDAAAAAILPRRVDAVLDLGAGTGKFTGLLAGRARRVYAVEPSEQMLAVLRATLPAVDARIGSAEHIPLADASVDAVTVAQAFHWFDRDPACAEIARVLRAGGVLGMLWNDADPACTWDRACHRIAHPGLVGEGGEPSAASDPAVAAEPPAASDPAAIIGELPGFAFERMTTHPWSERITRDDYVQRWLTVSSFLAADPPMRAQMVAAVEQVLDTDPATAGRAAFTLPQITDVFVYRVLS